MSTANDPFILYDKNQRVVTLTLNNPERMNAIGSLAHCAELVDAIERANGDQGVSVIIITGAGNAFCAGGNVKTMLDCNPEGVGRQATPAQTRNNYRNGIQRIPLALWNVEVPVIAAVNGAAIGAGCDLACMADIRIASENARFAESFLKVGLIPGDGGAWFLPRVVGFSKAAELTFTGDMLDAQRALACGLVSSVVPADQLLAEAQTLAARIAANPPTALRLSKRLLRESHHSRLPELLEMSAALQALVHETEDHAEAVQAFIEKRKPVFKGE